MSSTTGQPRTRCRLPCTIRTGRRRIPGRVLDVSSGGLCFVAPVSFRLHAYVNVEIVEPRCGSVAVQGQVRHHRPFRHPSSGRRGWATGLALGMTGPEFLALTSPGASRDREVPDGSGSARRVIPDLLVAEQSLYRVRLKAVGSARTRTLTLRAVSASAVCEAVLRDLPGDWEVLDVEANPID